ncbi:hypothetical protein ABPG77_004642 [Micractinium sp. CCAP 211/92]
MFQLPIADRALLEGQEDLFPPNKSHNFGKEHAAKLRAMNGDIVSFLRMGALTGINAPLAVLVKTLIDEEVFAKAGPRRFHRFHRWLAHLLEDLAMRIALPPVPPLRGDRKRDAHGQVFKQLRVLVAGRHEAGAYLAA